ncbi:MAG: hypothetical protein E7605_07745 [Ruminococcaceae bacterium]|nr:hypothetical protein [Oscillospiraceae bacterium]
MQESASRHTLEEILTSVEQDEALKDTPAEAVTEPATLENGASEEALSGLGALLSKPELLAKLPLLLKAVQTLTEPADGGQEIKKPETPVALLCALRPYLNEHRRQALETMIRVSKLSESLRSLQ